MYNYTHQDWKEFKKAFQLKNKGIAEIIGLTPDSVKIMTQPKKPLPTWAKAFIWCWKNEIEKL